MRESRWYYYFYSSTLVQKLLAKLLPCPQVPLFNFLTPMTSFLTRPKNDFCKNCRSRPLVSNAVYRLSLAYLVFETVRGGGGYSPPPPPAPVRTKLAKTPVGAEVKIVEPALGAWLHCYVRF